MESLNFKEGQVIGLPELVTWNNQLRESMDVIIDKLGIGVFGRRGVILKNTLPLENDLKVEAGSSPIGGYNTIKLNAGWGVGYMADAYVDPIISSNLATILNGLPKTSPQYSKYAPFYSLSQDNISIPGIAGLGAGAIRYVTVYPRMTVFEDGTCNISVNNQVTFTDSKVVAKLKSQISKSPTKLKFFTSASALYNNGAVYEVVSIIDSNNIVISGTFSSPVSNLYVAIVGSYDLGSQALLSSAHRYNYGYVRGVVGFQSAIATVSNGGFPVAKLTFAADHSFTIEDIRTSNLFNFGATDALLARNNLSDLSDLDLARENLSVYKTEETYSMSQTYSKAEVYNKSEGDARYARPVSLGEKSAYDFTATQFNYDGNWYIWDVSSITPTAAKWAYFRIRLVGISGGWVRIYFMRTGYTQDTFNTIEIEWSYARDGAASTKNLWLPIDNGTLQYRINILSAGFSQMYGNILEWM